MRRSTLGWLAALAALASAQGAPIERDLGLGLLYFRAHALPADLPTDERIREAALETDPALASAVPNSASMNSQTNMQDNTLI